MNFRSLLNVYLNTASMRSSGSLESFILLAACRGSVF